MDFLTLNIMMSIIRQDFLSSMSNNVISPGVRRQDNKSRLSSVCGLCVGFKDFLVTNLAFRALKRNSFFMGFFRVTSLPMRN